MFGSVFRNHENHDFVDVQRFRCFVWNDVVHNRRNNGNEETPAPEHTFKNSGSGIRTQTRTQCQPQYVHIFFCKWKTNLEDSPAYGCVSCSMNWKVRLCHNERILFVDNLLDWNRRWCSILCRTEGQNITRLWKVRRMKMNALDWDSSKKKNYFDHNRKYRHSLYRRHIQKEMKIKIKKTENNSQVEQMHSTILSICWPCMFSRSFEKEELIGSSRFVYFFSTGLI